VTFVGLDPDAGTELVDALLAQAARANALADRSLQLCLAAGVDPSCTGTLDELARVWRSAASQLDDRIDQLAALTTRPASIALGRTDSALPTGSFATTGPTGLRLVRDHLALIEIAAGTEPDGRVSRTELTAVAEGDGRFRLPPTLRRAVRVLLATPVFFSNVASAPSRRISPDRNDESWLDAQSVDLALVQIAALRHLADRELFMRLDGIRGGSPDGLVSEADIRTAMDTGALTQAAAAALRSLIIIEGDPIGPPRSRVLQTGFRRLETSRPGPDDPGGQRDGLLSYDDVVAATVNLHVLADDPRAARRFVLGLVGPFDDISGASTGLSMRAHSDEGVRALAAAALADTSSIAEQVAVVARLPESRGGERNLLVTAYYAELARRMNQRLNDGLADAEDPSSAGHTGANWMMFAPFASDAIRPALTGRQSVYGMSPNWSDRQYLADGNQHIFGDIAPRYAAFLESFPAGQSVDRAALQRFFATDAPLAGHGTSHPPWRPGHRQLRDAFAHYAAVLTEDAPLRRQQMTFVANALIATHEQAGAQRALDGLLDQTWGDDEYRAVGAGVAALLGFDDRRIATDQMVIRFGLVETAPVIRLSRDLEPPLLATSNLLIGADLTTELNPALVAPALPIGLPDLRGWGDPPDGSGMRPFPVDAATWFSDGALIGSPDGNDLAGTGAHDWSQPADRQWFIVSMFRNMHTDAVLWRRRSDYGLQRRVGDRRLGDHLPRPARRELHGDRRK